MFDVASENNASLIYSQLMNWRIIYPSMTQVVLYVFYVSCFFYSSLERGCRYMRKPLIVQFFNSKSIGKHIYYLSNCDTSALNRQLPTYPLFP